MSRHVLVTGASRGIGRAVALAFARQGWDVTAGFRRETAEAERTASLAESLPGRLTLRQADLAAPGGAQALLDGLPPLDALVNNAGITRDAPLATLSAADWQAVLGTNLHALATLCRAAAAAMDAAGRGVIVNVGSSAAASARANQANYASAKSGLLGLSRSLAREMAGRGVRVLVVAPGFTRTDMADAVPDSVAAATLARIPLARWATPEEVAAAVLFAASDAAAGLAGQVVLVDGGRTVFETEMGL